MFNVNKFLQAVARACCFIFTAEYIVALVNGKEGIGLIILCLLIAITASLGWD